MARETKDTIITQWSKSDLFSFGEGWGLKKNREVFKKKKSFGAISDFRSN